ncbi:MAG: sodium/solute symporter [Pseudomonadota bacterium]
MSRRVRNAEDYFLAGRSLAWWVIGMSIIGTNVSAEGYVGAAGSSYRLGVAQANFEWIGAIPAMILAALIFIPVYWRAGVYSIPEYFGQRYNATIRVLAACISTLFIVFAVAAALWAIALILETFVGWPHWLSIVVSGTVVGLYSISGGLAAIAFTDALQVVIMFLCGVIIVALGIHEAGGAEAFRSALTAHDPDHLKAYLPADHPNFPWPAVILGLGIVLSPAYWCGSQVILQRTLAARTRWDASYAMMFAALAKTCVPLLIVFPGLLAIVLAADIAEPDQALPWVIKHVLPPGLSGLMFTAILAALQSSLDSSLNAASLMITRDIRGVLSPRADPAKDLRIGRLLTLLILLIGMFVAPFIGQLGGLYQFIQTMLSMFQGPLLALLLLGTLTRHASARAAVAVLVSGVTLSSALSYLGVNLLWVAFGSFAYSVLALWALSFLWPDAPDRDLSRLVFRRA